MLVLRVDRGLGFVHREHYEHITHKNGKSLEQQKIFQDGRSTADLLRKIISIFDEGYRLLLKVAKLDQMCLQPHFAKSNAQFSKH